MLIAICADSHDNQVNAQKFLTYCRGNKVGIIFHCGDWTKPEIFELFGENFKGKIYGVIGNAQINTEKIKQIAIKQKLIIEDEKIEIKIDNIRFAIVHRPEEARQLAKKDEHDIIFHGHTHKPWQEKIKNCYSINPGTMGGMFNPPTFALYNTVSRKLTLKRLKNSYLVNGIL